MQPCSHCHYHAHVYTAPAENPRIDDQDCTVLQDLARLASAAPNGLLQLNAKVQGPFEGHELSMEAQAAYSHLVACAGGIGITAVLPLLKRAALQRAAAEKGVSPPLHSSAQ